MRYALTVNPTGEWDAVQTHIIEDGLLPGEATVPDWKDGGELLAQVLTKLGYTQEIAQGIVRRRDWFIVNCDDVELHDVCPSSGSATPQNALEREISPDIPKRVSSLLRKELSNILDLATCDTALFNDGINLEIEACAKKGLDLLRIGYN